MNKFVFVLMSMVLFTGVMTGCNQNEEGADEVENNNQQIQIQINNNTNTTTDEQKVKPPAGVREIEIEFAISNDKKLPGTLTLPGKGSKFPCVVLVQGSGPNDRDETIFANKPFRDLAWGLAKLGIATYRYDKRTKVYQKDSMNDYKLTLDDEVVDDAVNAVEMLSNADDVDKDKIYVLGHSLGGYAIPRIAEKSTNSAGYIIMAGNVRRIDEIIEEQYKYIANLDGIISEEEQLQIDALKLELEKIKNINSLDSKCLVLGAYKEYWKDLKKYNPIQLAKEISKPVYVLQGARDYQVTITEYNLWKGAFGSIDNWSFCLYPDLNHLMIKGEGKSSPSEYRVKGNMDKNVINDIAKWIKNH